MEDGEANGGPGATRCKAAAQQAVGHELTRRGSRRSQLSFSRRRVLGVPKSWMIRKGSTLIPIAFGFRSEGGSWSSRQTR